MSRRRQCVVWLVLAALLCACFAAPSVSAAEAFKGSEAEYRALLIGEQRFLQFDDDSNPDSGVWLDDDDQRRPSGTSSAPTAPTAPWGKRSGSRRRPT